MANRRRRRKGGNFTTYIIVFISTCLIAYVGYLIISNAVQKTAVIEAGDMGNVYQAQVVIVRDEELIDTEGLTSVKYYADEGELLYKGSKIAEVYSTGYSQTDMNKLLNTRLSIKTQLKSTLSSAYVDSQLDILDEQALKFAQELGYLVSEKAQGNLINLERQITGALERRQLYLKEKYYSSDPALAELYDTEATLLKKIQSWTTTHLADRDCIISFYTDGWENVLALGALNEVTIQQVQSILLGETPTLTTAQRGRTAVFRKVNPSGWYLLLLSEDRSWNPVEGQSYKVHLAGFDNYIVDGVVMSNTIENTQQLVRMRVTGDVRPVLNLRSTSAEVGEVYVSGLKVPLNALKQQDGQWGIVLTDQGGLFVPVQVIMQDNSYAVIESMVPGYLREGQKIRLF